jgi:hypothetical protein
LLQFLAQLDGNRLGRYGETVNLSPLFSCQGALEGLSAATVASALPRRLANARPLARIAVEHCWRPLLPNERLRSGILLLQAADEHSRELPPDVLRRRFHEAGLALSAYNRGVVRVSLPSEPWRRVDLQQAAAAFASVAQSTPAPRPVVCAG